MEDRRSKVPVCYIRPGLLNCPYRKIADEAGVALGTVGVKEQNLIFTNGEDLNFSSLLRVIKALDISLLDFFKEGFE